jgi:hypothetical protein
VYVPKETVLKERAAKIEEIKPAFLFFMGALRWNLV